MQIGIVLAGGKGTRFKSKKTNKTVAKFHGKPLVKHGTDLLSMTCDKVVVVVGFNSEGVIDALRHDPKILFAHQKLRLGTGHATKTGFEKILEKGILPDKVFVGYGDHMMFYTPKNIKDLSDALKDDSEVISMITCDHKNPDSTFWGRIIRNKKGNVEAIVEQKVASTKQRKIKELNAGLYCFRYEFLKESLPRLKKNKVSREYYLTDLIEIANNYGLKVVAQKIPFENVGLGINSREELDISAKLYEERIRDH